MHPIGHSGYCPIIAETKNESITETVSCHVGNPREVIIPIGTASANFVESDDFTELTEAGPIVIMIRHLTFQISPKIHRFMYSFEAFRDALTPMFLGEPTP